MAQSFVLWGQLECWFGRNEIGPMHIADNSAVERALDLTMSAGLNIESKSTMKL